MMTPTATTSVRAELVEALQNPSTGSGRTDMTLLDVKNLTVSFNGKSVVHGINFSIKAGERIALVGESGSGKTVTALSLLRLVMNAELRGTAMFG